MYIIMDAFLEFISKEKVRSFLAFLAYFFTIVAFTFPNESISPQLQFIFSILLISIFICSFYTAATNCLDKWYGNEILEELKKIVKEIEIFIIFLFLTSYIASFFIIGEPANEQEINQLIEDSHFMLIYGVIIAPIIEEYIFRFLPYKFIKNKILYIAISSFVFAGMHVINDSNAFYYIWLYMITSVYYGYRYYKTKDILVTISLHIINNLIAVIS